MKKKVNILLVCTGNIFRSISAGKLLKQHLAEIGENRFAIKTAGTQGDTKKKMHEQTMTALKECGVDASSCSKTKLTSEHIEWADTILAMADYHQEYIQKHYSAYAHLYNDFAVGKKTNVDDVNDVIANYEEDEEAVREHIKDTVAYLHEVTPQLAEKLQDRHFLFQELADGTRDKHLNGAEFEPLLESENALAFLSLDVPYGQDGHVLVIPKNRYRHFHKIPEETSREMNALASQIGEAFQKHHSGYNLLLNNGHVAGQYFYHAHLHVIPRDLDDGIQMEVWDHHQESPKAHRKHHKYLEKLLADA